MTETIFDKLTRERADAARHNAETTHHTSYHAPSDATAGRPEGTSPMSILSSIEQELTAAETKASEVWNHVKTIAEQHLPQAAEILQAAESNPVVDAGLRFAHLPPTVLEGAANMLIAFDAALQGGQAPALPPAPPVAPVEPPVPADQPA